MYKPFSFNIIFLLSAILLLITGCHNTKQEATTQTIIEKDTKLPTSISPDSVPEGKSRTASYLDSLGLINIHEADSNMIIKLMYATPDNFTGELLYDDLREAYLHPQALQSLLHAQKLLKDRYPKFNLIVYDAARPMSVQKKMWNTVKGTSKSIYVSNPAHGGGLHNYGLAVDVSIADSTGRPIPMGTEVDYFGIEAHITNENALLENKKISKEEYNNRILLRQIMRQAGFHALNTEWWHFNRCSREKAKQHYKVIE